MCPCANGLGQGSEAPSCLSHPLCEDPSQARWCERSGTFPVKQTSAHTPALLLLSLLKVIQVRKRLCRSHRGVTEVTRSGHRGHTGGHRSHGDVTEVTWGGHRGHTERS